MSVLARSTRMGMSRCRHGQADVMWSTAVQIPEVARWEGRESGDRGVRDVNRPVKPPIRLIPSGSPEVLSLDLGTREGARRFLARRAAAPPAHRARANVQALICCLQRRAEPGGSLLRLER
jgi:hypothetical protein